jgi:opacity protein-like surface antigen
MRKTEEYRLMRTRFLLATGVTALFAATAAFASTPGYYVSGDAGVSLLPDLHVNSASSGTSLANYDAGYDFGGGVGYDFGNGMRVELNSQHASQNLANIDGAPAYGHLSSTSLMLDGQIDLIPDSCGCVTPYVGAGLGGVNFGGVADGYEGRSWKPGYELEAGLRDDITHQLSVFGGYRFSQAESVRMTDPTIPDSATQHFSDHLLMAGLTYHLNQ